MVTLPGAEPGHHRVHVFWSKAFEVHGGAGHRGASSSGSPSPSAGRTDFAGLREMTLSAAEARVLCDVVRRGGVATRMSGMALQQRDGVRLLTGQAPAPAPAPAPAAPAAVPADPAPAPAPAPADPVPAPAPVQAPGALGALSMAAGV
jgi:hypothetical protein